MSEVPRCYNLGDLILTFREYLQLTNKERNQSTPSVMLYRVMLLLFNDIIQLLKLQTSVCSNSDRGM